MTHDWAEVIDDVIEFESFLVLLDWLNYVNADIYFP